MLAHLRKPTLVPPPAAYTEYCLERRFWEEFGSPQPPLDDWPKRKVAEYTCIQRALDEVARERERTPAVGSGPASPGPSTGPATEQAYQQMRAQAVTPVLPSPPT